MIELTCAVQTYEWGKHGKNSKVAEYAKTCCKDFELSDSKPYAELWMGDHPNGPCFIKSDSCPLSVYLKKNKKVLGAFESLPFLFKVLSIEKALSIQAHPDKKLAAELHEKFPNVYKDANHKPEMTLALTEFEALCGFRDIKEIIKFTDTFEEFGALFDAGIQEKKRDRELLKEMFTTLMKTDNRKIVALLQSLNKRLENKKHKKRSIEELFQRIYNQFPDDIGCFCLFFLNYVILKPGDAMFLKANEPHAYISGDCVECMASSDNVVRAGLTPKLKDVEVLTKMLTYEYGSAESKLLKEEKIGMHSLLYDPPIDEFSVVAVKLKENEREELKGVDGPSILIVTEGEGQINDVEVKSGQVFLNSAGNALTIQTISNIAIFIATCGDF
ncbi:mannose-6-phosphate isomerase [Rozella allomycis CSF55]|uniref:Mannose-6-phosphate isomerase n=1 Tax=Rozella allomycis (strain CSF55) TaxID=988480 RepID=A0A4P9YHC2_ROZAC|nr:mannose-6-phosphate isomerase [Rozella allomycis CSF55]